MPESRVGSGHAPYLNHGRDPSVKRHDVTLGRAVESFTRWHFTERRLQHGGGLSQSFAHSRNRCNSRAVMSVHGGEKYPGRCCISAPTPSPPGARG